VELPPLADLLALLRSQGVRRFGVGELHVEFTDAPAANVGSSRPEPPAAPNAVDLALEGAGKTFDLDKPAAR
jgi:hypothetical protein